MSRGEAEKMGKELLESGENQWTDFETRLQETIKGFLKNMDICKTTDLKKLEKKVKAIDMRLKALEEPKEKKAAKK
jgi:polyhydroxyalkanoate synthesis regulator phasin